ncbi:hypothetical protein BCR44DRAFT_1503085 [Catenaria anguillulae PL171]|uniref:Phospholipid-transporting ATPase n=1 Tax=Catenaria anguillulae PL171 TaxID=765915 RepID=A0A1Y2HAX0_9FUNG|nr:hypothetical protein BCR44DRAFT_1503085 [Catenaria anguillulae PL171]
MGSQPPTPISPTAAGADSGTLGRTLTRAAPSWRVRMMHSLGLRSTQGASKLELASVTNRIVYFGSPPTTAAAISAIPEYCSNAIRTAKYTVYNFVPRNLLEQFSRVANLYFLLIVVLQMIPSIRTTHPALAAMPMTVIVLVTAAKDAFEDWKRHTADTALNNAPARVLAGAGWWNPNHPVRKKWYHRLMFWKRGQPGMTVTPMQSSTDGAAPVDPAAGANNKPNAPVQHYGLAPLTSPQTKPSNAPLPPPISTISGVSGASDTTGSTLTESSLPPMPQSTQVSQVSAQTSTTVSSVASAEMPASLGRSTDPVFNSPPPPPLNNSRAPAASNVSPIPPHRRTLNRKQRSSFLTPIPTASWSETSWAQLRVGDIVQLKADEPIPADIVILSASGPNSTCYVETKSLDGETNLKLKHGLPEFAHVSTAEQCEQLRFTIESEPPNPMLYTYRGTLRVVVEGGDVAVVPVVADNLLLRGCVVRNTDWVIGAVMYTGDESKIMLNSGDTPSKRSLIDRKMNPQILLNFALLFALCTTCATLNATWKRTPAVFGYTNAAFFRQHEHGGNNAWQDGVFTFFSSLVVFQNIVPISLYITIEFTKTVQAYFIYADEDLALNPSKPCIPRTWNISDDLGHIQYVFSDKTGTLTQNVMEFKMCCVGGHLYGGGDKDEFLKVQAELSPNPYVDANPSFVDANLVRQLAAAAATNAQGAAGGSQEAEWAKTAWHFFTLLATCHTVLVERSPTADGLGTALEYKAQSPDEAALVAAARDAGFVFLARNNTHLHLSLLGQQVWVELLHVIEFDSTRKRMSVIIRNPSDGKVFVYTKGADSVLFARLAGGQDDMTRKVTAALQMYATEGLRTLVLAYRELSSAEYNKFAARFHSASVLIDGRDAALASIGEELEQDLVLLGATAIEDKLQVGVPEAIETLSLAGVHVWVLTGDKTETAINVGFACNLITPEMALVLVHGSPHDPGSVKTQMAAAVKMVESASLRRQGAVLVIDGEALAQALDSPMQRTLLKLCLMCQHVICCRVSPLQKAQVVALVRRQLKVLTLAIGDGANDVSMIQEADVGVGISGEEGMQAVMSSDYAIGQFRFLIKLMLLHGRWSTMRVAGMIMAFFLKNMTWVFIMFWYQRYAGFSAELMYDYTFLMFYNLIFTLFPSMVLGMFEQDVPESSLSKFPQLYKSARNQFTNRRFWIHVAEAAYMSLACFFLPFHVYHDAVVHPEGYNPHKLETTLPIAMTAVLAVNLFVGLNMRAINWISGLGIFISAISLMLYLPIYSLLPGPMEGFAVPAYTESGMWLTVLLSVCTCLLPRYVIRYARDAYWYDDSQIIREVGLLGKKWPTSRCSRFALGDDHDNKPLLVNDSLTEPAGIASEEARDRVLDQPLTVMTDLPHMQQQQQHSPQDPFGTTQSKRTSLMFDAETRLTIDRTGFAFSHSRGASETVSSVMSPATPTAAGTHHRRRASLTPSLHSLAGSNNSQVLTMHQHNLAAVLSPYQQQQQQQVLETISASPLSSEALPAYSPGSHGEPQSPSL